MDFEIREKRYDNRTRTLEFMAKVKVGSHEAFISGYLGNNSREIRISKTHDARATDLAVIITDLAVNQDWYVDRISEAEFTSPSPAEQAAAKSRLAYLDMLSPKCDWDSLTPSADAMAARIRWQEIMDKQAKYEAEYC